MSYLSTVGACKGRKMNWLKRWRVMAVENDEFAKVVVDLEV